MPLFWTGLLSVIVAGIAQGSFMLPMKWTTRWKWENTWLIFACTAYLLCPWLLVLSTIPQVFQVYGAAKPATLLAVILFGAGWGVGAVTFGLGVAAIGLALGFIIILGLAGCMGTLVPLLFLPAGSLSTPRIALTVVSMLLMLAGVAISSFAGAWKQKESAGTISYRKGVAVCILSGILSACGNLGFVFGSPIIDRAQALGVPAHLAPNVVWALLTLALFFCNAGYAILRLRRNHSAGHFALAGTRRYFPFAMLMGILWMASFVFYGAGARMLGQLGPSLGWAILMSTMVLTANLLGVLSGEWRGAPAIARTRLRQGLLLLTAAILGLGYVNWMHS